MKIKRVPSGPPTGGNKFIFPVFISVLRQVGMDMLGNCLAKLLNV